MAQRLGRIGEGIRRGAFELRLQGRRHETALGLDAAQQHLLTLLIGLLEGQIEQDGDGDEGGDEKNQGGGQRATEPAHQCLHSP